MKYLRLIKRTEKYCNALTAIFLMCIVGILIGFKEQYNRKKYTLGVASYTEKGVLVFTMEGVEFQRIPLKEICK